MCSAMLAIIIGGGRSSILGGLSVIKCDHTSTQSVPSRGVWGHDPPGKFWILSLIGLDLVHSQTLRF